MFRCRNAGLPRNNGTRLASESRGNRTEIATCQDDVHSPKRASNDRNFRKRRGKTGCIGLMSEGRPWRKAVYPKGAAGQAVRDQFALASTSLERLLGCRACLRGTQSVG